MTAEFTSNIKNCLAVIVHVDELLKKIGNISKSEKIGKADIT